MVLSPEFLTLPYALDFAVSMHLVSGHYSNRTAMNIDWPRQEATTTSHLTRCERHRFGVPLCRQN